MAPKKKNISATLRRLVWQTYVGLDVGSTLCMCCQQQIIYQLVFECGHVIAESQGGATILENLRPICTHCNRSMGTMSMAEFMRSFNNFTPMDWNLG